MGREAGTAGSFVMPAARSYAYTRPASVAGPLVMALINRPLSKNDADPIYDLLGAGRVSHPQEWAETVAMLQADGVDVVFRKGVMAYGPQSASGKPGRLIIDPDASIGALRHETQHYLDDKALGFPGMRVLLSPTTRWQMEYAAYLKEINFTRQLRAFPTGRQLLSNARAEKEFIIKNYGPVK